jgi:hypothetical protein
VVATAERVSANSSQASASDFNWFVICATPI